MSSGHIRTVAPAGQANFPVLPSSLLTNGSIPVAGVVDSATGRITWYDGPPEHPEDRDPTPDEILIMCQRIRAQIPPNRSGRRSAPERLPRFPTRLRRCRWGLSTESQSTEVHSSFAAPCYFRVRDQAGKILADLLPERQARLFCDRWNSRPVGRSNPVRLVPLTVTERVAR